MSILVRAVSILVCAVSILVCAVSILVHAVSILVQAVSIEIDIHVYQVCSSWKRCTSMLVMYACNKPFMTVDESQIEHRAEEMHAARGKGSSSDKRSTTLIIRIVCERIVRR